MDSIINRKVRITTKKRLEGGKRKRKRKIQEFGLEMQDKEDVPIQS
jgi:hypothetical protein